MRLTNRNGSYCDDCSDHRDYYCRCDPKIALYEKLKQYENAEEQGRLVIPRWIPVTERLPELGERVLVANGGGFVCESFLAKNGKWQRGGVDMFFMTPAYWMPLPQPPTECRQMVTDSNQVQEG